MTRILLLTLVLLPLPALAEEPAYYEIPLAELVAEGPARQWLERYPYSWSLRRSAIPRVLFRGEGAACVLLPERDTLSGSVHIRHPGPGPFSAILFVPNRGKGMSAFPFRVDSAKTKPGTADGFAEAERQHYERLVWSGAAGGEWFRQKANTEPDEEEEPRAIDLEPTERKPFDYQALLGEAEPILDDLASLVPADQPTVFCPSLGDLKKLVREVDEVAAPILFWRSTAAVDRRIEAREDWRRLFGPGMVASALGPAVVERVALTCSDHPFRSDSEFAIVVQVNSPALVGPLLKPRPGSTTHRAQVGERTFVISKSLTQLKAVTDAATGVRPSLATNDAYRYFRSRYPVGEPETAFLVIPDVAGRILLEPERVALDFTILPLRVQDSLADMIRISGNTKLEPGDADPHPQSLFHWVLAVDRNSKAMRELGNQGLDILNWIGDTMSIYVDRGVFFEELSKAKDLQQFFMKDGHRIPIALRVDVRSAFKFLGFIMAARTAASVAAPNGLIFENRSYRDLTYTRVTQDLTNIQIDPPPPEYQLFYISWSGTFLVTLDEEVLKRAIDRQKDKKEDATHDPWLGESMAMRADGEILKIVEGLAGPELLRNWQDRSFSNLFILNEWHRLHPDEDPVAVHERKYGERLVCPGGGVYRWNRAFQTMESSVYGHPASPKDGPAMPEFLQRVKGMEFGVSFRDGGVRANCEISRKPETK